MDREAWSASIHGVIKRQTRLSDWTELNWMVTRYILVLVSVCWFWRTVSLSYISVLPNLFGTRDQFYGRQFFYRLGGWDGFRMIEVRYISVQFSSVFSTESTFDMRWPKYWSFSFTITPSNEHPRLISVGWTGWISVQSKGLSRVFSNTTVQKHQFFGAQLS